MRRAIPAVFAAVLLLLASAVRLVLPASAADSVILVVTGYKINDPREESMPFFQNGQLYVSVGMFVTLGLTGTEQPSSVLLSNMKSGKILYFDSSAGTAADAFGGVYQAAAVRKNGLWFVPAAFTCEHLDLTYVYNDVTPAPFVRITYPDDNLMSNDSFLRYYRSTAPEILNRFYPETTPAITTPPPVTTPPTTAATTASTPPKTTPASSTTRPTQTTPPATTTPATTTPPPAEYRVYLAVEGLADLDAALAALQSRRISAVFCLDPSDVAENGALLRRILVAGHGFAFAGNANTTLAALNTANDLLFAHTRALTRLVIGELSADAEAALAAAGYIVCRTNGTLANDSASIAAAEDVLSERGSAIFEIPSAAVPAAVAALHSAIGDELPMYLPLPEFGPVS